MKKLLIGIIILCSSYLVKAQDTLTVTIRVTVKQANLILDGLGELKLKDALPVYFSVTSQVQGQIYANQMPKQLSPELSAPPSSGPNKFIEPKNAPVKAKK